MQIDGIFEQSDKIAQIALIIIWFVIPTSYLTRSGGVVLDWWFFYTCGSSELMV